MHTIKRILAVGVTLCSDLVMGVLREQARRASPFSGLHLLLWQFF